MASNNTNANITFTGNASGLTTAANQAAKSIHGVADASKNMSAQTVAAGMAIGQAYTAMAGKVIHAAKDFMSEFVTVGTEVRKLKSLLGGTAEEMSRFRFVAEEVGVSVDTLARGMRMLGSHLAKNDDAAQKLGVTYLDMNGKMKPSLDLLGEVADKMNALPNEIERNALGMQLFGRGFQEMLPMLRLGSEGMRFFAEEADKMGLVLSDKNLVAVREYTMSKRQLHAAVSGVAVSIGSMLIPKITALTVGLTQGVVSVVSFVKEHKGLQTALQITAGVLGGIIFMVASYKTAVLAAAGATKLMEIGEAIMTGIRTALTAATTAETGAQIALNTAMEVNPIGAIVVAIELLIVGFIALMRTSDKAREVFVSVMTVMGKVVGMWVSYSVQAFRLTADAMLNFVGWILNGADKAFGWIPGIGGKISKAKSAVDDFHSSMDDKLTDIADFAYDKGADIGEAIGKGITDFIKNFKLPKIELPETPETGGGDSVLDPLGGGGAGKGGLFASLLTMGENIKKAYVLYKQQLADAANNALEDTKSFWSNIVDKAQTAMNEAKAAADDAQARVADAAKSIAESMSRGFEITALAGSSFAKYLGADALVASFRQRLADMKEFVGDIKKLRSMGLAPDLLAQIAAAGPQGGLDTARLLVNDPSAIQQLNGLQAEMTAGAAEAGAVVSDYQYGGALATANANYGLAQTSYNLAAGQQSEAVMAATNAANAASAAVTAASNIEAGHYAPGGDMFVQVQAETNADPSDIAQAVAWAIKTNTPVVAAVVPTRTRKPVQGGRGVSRGWDGTRT